MKGRVFVRHLENLCITHSGRYLRLDGISVEITDEWENVAKGIHTKYDDLMWRTTLERIIRLGLKAYKNRGDIDE